MYLSFPGDTSGKDSACQCGEMRFQSLSGEGPLEEVIALHTSILVWRIARTEEPGGLQSTGSQRVEHD